MILSINRKELYNDISETIRSFLPDEAVDVGEPCDLRVSVYVSDDVATAEAIYTLNGVAYKEECKMQMDETDALHEKRYIKRAGKLAVYRALCRAYNRSLPWGSLTGIRPTKMMYEGASRRELNKVYGVTDQKCDLLERIIKNQTEFIDAPADAFDIYIGIPFCKTRCVYCSFATNDATKSKLIPEYMRALVKEIRLVSEFLNRHNKKPRCLYIGGGTPTALDEENLKLLLDECKSILPSFEFTVEAGRPDTLNRKKLEIIKEAEVGRISINPQTMHEQTLNTIGRMHSVEDIISCYRMATEIGFDNINMDLIAGLPGETSSMFEESLNSIMELDPANITVHTLSVKRGSRLSENPAYYVMPSQEEVERMVSNAYLRLTGKGYEPYYLYRQKYQSGNLENVGYCRKGTECIYNIDIMEETTSIIALGAGGVSKRVYKNEGRIERCANSKSIFDYIVRIGELTSKKIGFFDDLIK